MDEKDNELNKLLDFDALDTAERISRNLSNGESNVDFEIPAIAVALLQMNEKRKNNVLTTRGDTTFNSKISDYLGIATYLGFEIALELPFEKIDKWDDTSRQETYYVMARRDGLILSFDTYNGTSISGGSLYYQLKQVEGKDLYRATRSGGYYNIDSNMDFNDKENLVWVGNHDCREALVYKITELEKHAEILHPWPIQDGFLWFFHHGDDIMNRNNDMPISYEIEDANRKNLIAERVAMMPDWVQEIINLPVPAKTPRM